MVRRVFLVLAAALALAGFARAETLIIASTTSTEQSGLFGHLLPAFTKATGIEVKVIAVGTGQAIDIARRGEADVLFVHDRPAEEKFIAEGGALKRYTVMYNDFVLLGPKSDPAGAKGRDIVQAFKKISAADAPFISRSDRSGTHTAELRFWTLTGHSDRRGAGYKECGCGMNPALKIATSGNAYVLSDRGTWLSFTDPGDLAILVQGDPRLYNQYAVMVVSPYGHPNVKVAAAQKFVDWVTSRDGQATIAAYRVNGQQLFFPNAGSH
jgi:tungstate transport system substrate-binding protein